jgi:V/A-type H+-transporting ATPase subunit C
MAGSVHTYAFINAKLRARISKLIPDSFFERIGAARSLTEALALLKETAYGIVSEIYEKTGDLKLGELELFGREVALYRELEKHLQGDLLDFLHALAVRFEVDIVKNALRLFFDRKVRGRSIDTAVHYLYREPILHDFSVDAVINAEEVDEIVQALGKTPYGPIVEENRSAVEGERTLFRLEVELDRLYYSGLLQAAKKLDLLDQRVALRLIGVEIDLLNLGWVLRFKAYSDLQAERVLSLLIPGGHGLKQETLREAYVTQNVGEALQKMVHSSYAGLSSLLGTHVSDGASRLRLIERILEAIMRLEVQRMLMGNPFGIGIMLAYFTLKRNELKTVRTLLNAKQYMLSEDKMRELI